MYKTGVFTGKFMPLHKGHIRSVKIASKQVEKLYVVVCHNQDYMKSECEKYHLPDMSMELRVKWVKNAFKRLKNVEVVSIDQTKIEPFPKGIEDFSKKLKELVGKKIDVFFGGEKNYQDFAKKSFGAEYVLIDPERKKVPISATMIRHDLKKNHRFLKREVKKYLEK